MHALLHHYSSNVRTAMYSWIAQYSYQLQMNTECTTLEIMRYTYRERDMNWSFIISIYWYLNKRSLGSAIVFKYALINTGYCILIPLSLEFVVMGRSNIKYKIAYDRVAACAEQSGNPLPGPTLTKLREVKRRHWVTTLRLQPHLQHIAWSSYHGCQICR